MNVQRVVSSVYFENINDSEIKKNITLSLQSIDPKSDFDQYRTLYTTTNEEYKNEELKIAYVLDNLFFEKLYGNTISRLYKSKKNTIFIFPIFKDIDSSVRLTPALDPIYKRIVSNIKNQKEFNRDVGAETNSGNMYLFVPAFSDVDETDEEFTSTLNSYFERAFEFINEQKPLKVGDIIKPSLYGKFENIIYSVDKEGQFFTNYYKKKLPSSKVKILNGTVQGFTDKFGRGSTSKDPFLSMTKEESLRKYKADGAESLSKIEILPKFYTLLETFIDGYKKTNDIEYLRSAVSSDNQSIFRIFYRINNTDFVDEFDKIKVGSNYVYKKTDYSKETEDCRIGYFIEKRGLTNQYVFREYTGLTGKHCIGDTPDEDKEFIEKEIEDEDLEESKDKIYKEGAIEIFYRNRQFYYRNTNKPASYQPDGKIDIMFNLHIYEKYKWFQFSDLGSSLNPETKIRFYNNILFDKKSFVEFLKKKEIYTSELKIPIEFLRINQDNKLLLEYVDYLLVFKKKTHVFRKTFFGIREKMFIERTKKAITEIIFQTNEVIYMTKQKSKTSNPKKNKNYKIINYKYYPATEMEDVTRHFEKKLYEDIEIKYCKKNKCELNEEYSGDKKKENNKQYAIVILDATRDDIPDVSILKQKAYCKQSRKNLLRYVQPYLNMIIPRFGGKTHRKTRKRLYSRRRKYRH